MNFMEFVAQELREYMAALGIRTVDELVGRSDLLRVREKLVTHRAETLDLRSLLENPWSGGPVPLQSRRCLRLPSGADPG